MTRVRTNKLVRSCVSKNALTFVFHSLALALAMIVGLTMALISGFGTPAFGYWIGLFGVGLGGFIPQPKLKSDSEQPRVTDVATQRTP